MEIPILINESDIMREHPNGSHSVKRNTGVFNKRRENGSNRSMVPRDTVCSDRFALLSMGSVRRNERKAVVQAKSSLTRKDNAVLALKRKIGLKDASDNDQRLFFFHISTEAVKDRYAIEKIALDMPYQKISKYREAQAYHLLPEPVLEISI
jgi:hypothetical protein